jgi:hypothetical protein
MVDVFIELNENNIEEDSVRQNIVEEDSRQNEAIIEDPKERPRRQTYKSTTFFPRTGSFIPSV